MTGINIFDSNNSPMRSILWFPFYRWGSKQKLHYWPRAIQLVHAAPWVPNIYQALLPGAGEDGEEMQRWNRGGAVWVRISQAQFPGRGIALVLYLDLDLEPLKRRQALGPEWATRGQQGPRSRPLANRMQPARCPLRVSKLCGKGRNSEELALSCSQIS